MFFIYFSSRGSYADISGRDDASCADLVEDELSWRLDLLEVVARALEDLASEVSTA